MFVFVLLMGRGQNIEQLRDPRLRGADGRVVVHRDERRGRHRARSCASSLLQKSAHATRDVPGRLASWSSIYQTCGRKLRDPRRRAVSSVGYCARPHRGLAAGLLGYTIIIVFALALGPDAEREPGLPARHRPGGRRGQQLHPVRRADDVPLQPGRGAFPQGYNRALPGPNPIAVAVLLVQRCFWIPTNQRPGRPPSRSTCPTDLFTAGGPRSRALVARLGAGC